VYKVESQICSVNQSIVGLHKDIVSLSTMRTCSSDGDEQIYGQRFFSSDPDGVFNLLSSFMKLRVRQASRRNARSAAHTGSVICASTRTTQSRYLIRPHPLRPCDGCSS